MRKVADDRIDRGNTRAPVDRAFADIAARIDAEAKEHGGSARPLLEHVAWKVPAGEHWRHEVRRFGDSIVATPAGAVAARTAARTGPYPARTRAGSGKRSRALRRRGSLARRLTCGDLRHRRDDDPRLWRLDRRRLAPDVGRRRSSLFLLRLRLLF